MQPLHYIQVNLCDLKSRSTFLTNLRCHIISIQRKFYQNRFEVKLYIMKKMGSLLCYSFKVLIRLNFKQKRW